jgi:nitroreductase
MNPVQAIVTRRSVTRLRSPAPDDSELLSLLRGAMTAPDHGRLRPWRLILLRGEARQVLGAALAKVSGDREARERALVKPMRAPLLVSIVFTPHVPHRVPEWEQLAAVAAMVQNLSLLLHARRWGSIWRSGKDVDAEAVREALRLAPPERLLGWLYVGTPDGPRQAPRHIDGHTPVAAMDHKGDIQSLAGSHR